jgi:hypothetical protein
MHAKQMSKHAAELQGELNLASKALKHQQKLLDELKTRSSKDTLTQEKDNSQRAVIHLTSLISGQMAYIERVMSSLLSPSRPNSQQEVNKEVTKRRSFQRSPSPQTPMSPISQMRRMPSRRNTVDLSQQSYAVDRSDKRPSQDVRDIDSFEDKIRVISETVRKINHQCFRAIEDLAAERENKGISDSSNSDEEERSSSLRTPDLDSRAETALSGSIAETVANDEEGGHSPSIRIQAIVEEMESDVEGEDYVDAAQIVGKKNTR